MQLGVQNKANKYKFIFAWQTNSHCFQVNQNFEKVGQCQESLYFAIYFQFSLLTILHVGSTLGDGGCKTNTQIYRILPTNAQVRSTPLSTLIITLCSGKLALYLKCQYIH